MLILKVIRNLYLLQKYRLYLKRISSVATQQANMAAALGVKDSSFMHMGSLDGLGDYRTLAGERLPNIALSPYTTSTMLGRLNSPANVNLRNYTPSSLVQPSQPQNLITSLGKMNLVLSPAASQSSSLFQGIPSSLELDQLQQNKGPTANFNTIDNSRIFNGAAIGSSSNLLNNNANNPVILSGGGFGNHSTQEITSFGSDSFNAGGFGSSNLLDPGKCNDNWQNTTESSKMPPNALLSSEPFNGELHFDGSRKNDSSNDVYLQNNSVDFASGVAIATSDVHNMNQSPSQRWGEQRQSYAHSSSNNIFGSLNSHIPGNGIVSPLDQSSGILNQKMDMFVNGRSSAGASTLMQQNDTEKGAPELRPRSNEDFLLEQPKLQGGFVPQSYDSLDELVNAMIKRVRFLCRFVIFFYARII